MSAVPVLPPGIAAAAARLLLAQSFRSAGLDTPDLDARILLGHALGLGHASLAAAPERVLSAADIASVSAFAARRLAREPVARILGRREFWSLDLLISAGTLVPRPETETLVELALDVIGADGPRGRVLRIADLGTGSGAILLALISELPAATGIGTDISAAALSVARGNAERLGFAARVTFVECSFAAAIAEPLDLVVANPPYVASGDIAGLAADVRLHDPRVALDGGPDGLACYRAIAADAPRILAPGGWLIVELGAGQDGAVAEIFAQAGLALIPPRRDLAGMPRALAGRLSP